MNKERAGSGVRKRFTEIVSILSRHRIVKGVTPEKLREILEELGPTYVKLGQIVSTRPDILPEAYCAELAKLRTDAAPIPIETILSDIESEYGKPAQAVFARVEPEPLGSASIAQAHLATLPDGRQVVIKAQRPNIYETMERDVALLKKASRLAKFTPASGAVDFSMMLDELWKAAQHEMNFLEEAENLREFARRNRDVQYVTCPAVIDELVTPRILVLEYVDGIQIDNPEALREAGFDPKEIAARLAANFIKQVVDDRFFHADPHPGNIRVRDGVIVWLDLGMMGRLSDMDGAMLSRLVGAIALNDAQTATDVVLAIGVYKALPDRTRLAADIEVLLSRYRQMSLSSINIARVLDEFLSVARKHGISMPASLTMLGRSIVILESVLTRLDPDMNLFSIFSAHVRKRALDLGSLRERLYKLAWQFADSSEKLTAIPGQLSDVLSKALAGHATININVAGQDQERRARRDQNYRLSLSIISAALIVGAGIASLSDMPGFAGLPWLSALFLAVAALLLMFVFIRNKR
jgi:ubiquinone biosynthesis protein